MVELAEEPPLKEMAVEVGLEGNLERGRVEQKIDLVKWSRREDVKEAWEVLVREKGVQGDGLEKATWGFLGFVLGRNYSVVASMSKARRFGWDG